ncbi:MAG: ATP-binding protein [Trebonia sp.]
MKLFDPGNVVGVFRGFSDSGMEFHADLVLPYREELQSIPMHGQFVLVQLTREDEAVLGRITSVAAEGRLVSPIGEDYAIRAVRDDRPIPDELRDQYLKYRVDIRVLGVERVAGDRLIFVPSHRRLPHVGAKVALCSDEVLADVANAVDAGPSAAEIGFLAFGEFVYAGDDPRAGAEDWMVTLQPAILPKFQVAQLVSRRSFVFARAGFGKSNLIKLLFSRLYATDPALPSGGRAWAGVGTVIFDPDGEYFWPDAHGRPGLCDVPSLAERLVVFTGQRAPSPAYQSFVVDKVKLDIRQLSAQRVLGIALPADRQDQQNVTKLKSLGTERWTHLVDLIAAHRYDVDPAEIRRICGIKPANEEQQTNAIIGNMVRVVDALHDPSSQMLRALKTALSDGKLCVVDISQLRGQRGLQLASIILAEIFSHNQREFTKAKPEIVPCIAVVEEAQTVLAPSATSAEDSPFVSWVKEGRKYGLGAVLVTQQPGSIPPELLSQGDNFFVFHLLSAGDLAALKRANAHFSDDLLATLLNEPLVGHGVFWSSAPGTDRSARPYPLPVRVLSFEAEHRELRDPSYSLGPVDCYAARLRGRFRGALAAAAPAAAAPAAGVDAEAAYRKAAISALRNRPEFGQRLASGHGVAWGKVQAWLTQAAPPEEVVGDRFEWAYQVVRPALLEILGPEGSGWRTEKRPHPERPGASQTWILLTETVEDVEHATPPEEQP